MENVLIHQIVYRAFYPIAFLLVRYAFLFLRNGRTFGFFFWGIAAGVLIRSRFVEPYQIMVKDTFIDIGAEKNIALISDLHVGVYKDRRFLQRVVHTINDRKDIDYVLIAGDLTYEPTDKQSLNELLEPLGDIQVPVFAVLGNHDVEVPGPNLRDELISTLDMHGVIFLHNDIVQLESMYILGLGPYLSNEDEVGIIDTFKESDKLVVLTHNPDTTSKYTSNKADVTFVGHTHCGQIRPPIIYPFIRKKILPVEGDFDCGYSEEEYTKLFITRGLGEVILPLRFFNPPSIDIIHL